ncbi:helix-turn-helix domain-containing protein [Roseibium sp.]|uniref:helix-turn-helix domain-containing protein n=1 Tax=Roseibium sp. TaxID=1936156 RepID=UPI003B507F76
MDVRCRIWAIRSFGHSIDEMAAELGRSKCTIFRELHRNCVADDYKSYGILSK